MPDKCPLLIVRGLAAECGLRKIGSGYDENCFSYRDPINQLWFIVSENTNILVQLHKLMLVIENNKFTNKPVFVDKFKVDLYEPSSILSLRNIFWKLRLGLLRG